MREKAKRIKTSGPATSLTSNPLSQLSITLPDDHTSISVPAPPSDCVREDKPRPEFHVARTRKGGYPILLEKRRAGKVVTIIRNVSGNTDVLVAALKKRCAAGGKALADSVEIQGDHGSKVEAFLREKGL